MAVAAGPAGRAGACADPHSGRRRGGRGARVRAPRGRRGHGCRRRLPRRRPPDGRAPPGALREVVAGSSLRVLGPSSLGVANLPRALALTGNAAFAETSLPAGDVFVASQSGSALGALLSRGAEMGVGFAGMVSTGNELDLTLGEVCAAAVDDPRWRASRCSWRTCTGADAARCASPGRRTTAASRSSPTSSAVPTPERGCPSRTPARSPATTRWPTRSSARTESCGWRLSRRCSRRSRWRGGCGPARVAASGGGRVDHRGRRRDGGRLPGRGRGWT